MERRRSGKIIVTSPNSTPESADAYVCAISSWSKYGAPCEIPEAMTPFIVSGTNQISHAEDDDVSTMQTGIYLRSLRRSVLRK
jgi:hypothetical protein